MAQRTVCLCDGKYIGIETIYTVVNGQQINIPEKLKQLRIKSQNNELFCPCGCGANLILVAGDRNLREQHFRLKDGTHQNECHMITEGKVSVDSKIVLKCWLDEKLGINDIETRVPINHIADTNRKYEFSFLSREKGIALSYCHERVNLSDEKFEILKDNGQDIQIIYIVDIMNRGSNGQYPEALMKIQDRQGYCLLLDVNDSSYSEARLCAVLYAQDNDGFWREVKIAEGYLRDYDIDDSGQVSHKDVALSMLLETKLKDFEDLQLKEKKRREEYQKRSYEAIEHRKLELQKKQEDAENERRRRLEEARRQMERKEAELKLKKEQQDEAFKRKLNQDFSLLEEQVKDAEGNRWLQCEVCGLKEKESEFPSYGGKKKNLGICKKCYPEWTDQRHKSIHSKIREKKRISNRYDASICPECGGKLREKSGRFGNFWGCSNYPECHYTRTIKK